ncbi:hypothetical protein MOQ_000674 [Trypanosoma cruzi marinkellei]|uniref:Uncharacterized protein n=1 Tax=Trypanosoma cruzi marinkellei TaxID=85056 RepID=K2MV86_TRYCR|nr:hypothetical protein MOQ_000674 [Trypanosoma cruzi marinkellei]
MEGRIGAVFITIQLSGGPIDVLDFFYRAWNAELLRNAAAETTGCLLRFPLLRVNGTVCSGVVASVTTGGMVRVVSSGSIEAALAIADFVYTYVIRRLPALPRRTGTKTIASLQLVLSPTPPLPRGMDLDTSESAAEWLRERIASFTTAAKSGGAGDESRQTQWWRYLTESSVACRQYRHTLRIVCNFRQPPPLQLGRELDPALGRGVDDSDADAFFFESELMSVVPLGSVFVAVGHNPEKGSDDDMRRAGNEEKGAGHKRSRHENEMMTLADSSLEHPVEDEMTAFVPPPLPSTLATSFTAARASKTGPSAAAAAAAATERCLFVTKPLVKVEAMVYRSGRVFTTTDSVEGLFFFVEEVLIPLVQRQRGN